jgi:hypothetical protein
MFIVRGYVFFLTTLPPSCADCFKIWEPQPPGKTQGLSRPVMGLLYFLLTDICSLNKVRFSCPRLKNFRFPGYLRLKLRLYLTFPSPAVTLHTTRFNIQNFYVVLTLHFYVVYGLQNNKNCDFTVYTINRLFSYNRVGECSLLGTH